ncbi:MAG: SHOCT domain-containing protein [Pseudomonadota bacterium]
MTRAGMILSAILTPSLAAADPGDGYHHMGWSGAWMMGPFMMLVFLALIIGAVVLAVRYLGPPADRSVDGKAVQILRERFARGEIDQEEFESRRKSLDG